MKRAVAVLLCVVLIVPSTQGAISDQVPPSIDEAEDDTYETLERADEVVVENNPTNEEVPLPSTVRARSVTSALEEKLSTYKSLFESGALERVPFHETNLKEVNIQDGFLPNRTLFNGEDSPLDLVEIPYACVDVTPSRGNSSTTYQADASCSTDAQTGIRDLEARFDWTTDGTWDTTWTSTLQATHDYASSGEKVVTAQLRDSGGLTSVAQAVVHVDDPPSPCFGVSPQSGDRDTTFDVDASCSSDDFTPTAQLEVRWDWTDDGAWDTSWSTDKTASHSYDWSGTKTIRLQVKDGYHATDTTTRSVDVSCSCDDDGGSGGGDGDGGGHVRYTDSMSATGGSQGESVVVSHPPGWLFNLRNLFPMLSLSPTSVDGENTTAAKGEPLSNQTIQQSSHKAPAANATPFEPILVRRAPGNPYEPATRQEVDYEPGQVLRFRQDALPRVQALVRLSWIQDAFGTPGSPAPYDLEDHKGHVYAHLTDARILNGIEPAFKPLTLGQSSLYTLGHDRMLSLEDRAMQIDFEQVPGWTNETVETNTTNATKTTTITRYHNKLVVNLTAPVTDGQPVRVSKAWLESAGINEPNVTHEDGNPIPTDETATHVIAYPEHFSTLVIRDDDGEMDTSYQLDYSDDLAVKRLVLSSDALTDATSADLYIYGRADDCGSTGDAHHLLANGAKVADYNPCNHWSTSTFEWNSFSIPLSDLNSGQTNSFEVKDAHTDWSDRDIRLGMDQDNDYGRTDAEENGNSIAGELMWYLEITKSSTSNSKPDTPSAPSGPSSTTVDTSETYSASTTDPDGDDIQYIFRWDDGTTSTSNWVSSGTTVFESHAWSQADDYCVQVRAEDTAGATSNWSPCKWVTVNSPGGVIESSGSNGDTGTLLKLSNIQASAPIEVSYKYCYLADTTGRTATIKTIVDGGGPVDSFGFHKPATSGSGENRCQRGDASSFASRSFQVDIGVSDHVQFDYRNGDWRLAIADVQVRDVSDDGDSGGNTDPDDGGATGYQEDFEGDTSDWSFNGLWHTSERRSVSGFMSARFGRPCCDDYNTGDTEQGSLTSPWIQLPDSGGQLAFTSWYETEGSNSYDVMTVHARPSGGSWQQLGQVQGNMYEWTAKAYDLSTWAGQEVQIRFTFDTKDALYNEYEGWYIDDVEVGEPRAVYTTDWTHSHVSAGTTETKRHHDSDVETTYGIDDSQDEGIVSFEVQKNKYSEDQYAYLVIRAQSSNCDGSSQYTHELWVNLGFYASFDPCSWSDSSLDWGWFAIPMSRLEDGTNRFRVTANCDNCAEGLWLGVDTDSTGQYSTIRTDGSSHSGELFWNLEIQRDNDYETLERYVTYAIPQQSRPTEYEHAQETYTFFSPEDRESMFSRIREKQDGTRDKLWFENRFVKNRDYNSQEHRDGWDHYVLDLEDSTSSNQGRSSPTSGQYYTWYRSEWEFQGSDGSLESDRYMQLVPSDPASSTDKNGKQNPPAQGEDSDWDNSYEWNVSLESTAEGYEAAKDYEHEDSDSDSDGIHYHDEWFNRLHLLDWDKNPVFEEAVDLAEILIEPLMTVLENNGVSKTTAKMLKKAKVGMWVDMAFSVLQTGDLAKFAVHEEDDTIFEVKIAKTKISSTPSSPMWLFQNLFSDSHWLPFQLDKGEQLYDWCREFTGYDWTGAQLETQAC